MPTCCQGATCACKVSAVDGGHLVVSGSGQANDPFLLSADIALGVVDNLVFDMTLNGTGIESDPWLLSVNFAATARLADLPDVADTTANLGQVLAWNGTQWAPAPPTTAAAGSVTVGNGVTGDGSAGAPLRVVGDYRPTGAGGTQRSGPVRCRDGRGGPALRGRHRPERDVSHPAGERADHARHRTR